MDSAEANQVISALRTQAARISQKEGISEALAAQLHQLNTQLQNLASQT